MREKENDSNIGDKDEPGVTISFIEFDINKLTSLCAGHTVYDEENKCIHINDVDDLSNEEKYAILTAYT